MKVPPKRKGNIPPRLRHRFGESLNESPSEKEGKCAYVDMANEFEGEASMKVPPKRKGNCRWKELPNLYSQPQ